MNKLNALETQRNPPESRLRGQVPFTYTYRRQRGHTCSARFAFILILISQLRVGSCQLTRALNGRTELNLLDPRAVQAPTAKRQPPHCPYDNGRQRLEGPIVSVTVGISQAPASDASCRGVPLRLSRPLRLSHHASARSWSWTWSWARWSRWRRTCAPIARRLRSDPCGRRTFQRAHNERCECSVPR